MPCRMIPFICTHSSSGLTYISVQFISLCTSYISSNVSYIFELRFGTMLFSIIELSVLLCICGGIYPLGESILEGEGKCIVLVYYLWGWQVYLRNCQAFAIFIPGSQL